MLIIKVVLGFTKSIIKPAMTYLYGERLEQLRASELKKQPNEKQLRYCKYCDKSVVDAVIWQQHIESKAHRQSQRQWVEKNRPLSRVDRRLLSGVGLAVLLVGALIGFRLSR